MNRLACIPALLLAVALAAGQDPAVKTKPGVMAKVDSKVAADVKWINVHADLQLIPSKEGWAVVCSTKPGEYKIAWYGCKDGKATDPNYITITVDDASPVPDVSEFVKKVKTAYAKDVDPDKESLITLQEIYKLYSEVLADATKSKDIKTWANLLTLLQTSSKSANLDGKITNTRQEIASYLKTKLPTDPSKALDADGKKLASTLFKEVYTALKEVSK